MPGQVVQLQVVQLQVVQLQVVQSQEVPGSLVPGGPDQPSVTNGWGERVAIQVDAATNE